MKERLTIRKCRELEEFGFVDYSLNTITIIKYTEADCFSKIDIEDISYRKEHDCIIITPSYVSQRKLKFLCFIARSSTNRYNVFLYTPTFQCIKLFDSMKQIIKFLHQKSLT